MSNRRMQQFIATLVLLLVSASSFLHSEPTRIRFDFNGLNDRVWVGRRFWAVPLEDWRVRGGRLECLGRRPEMRVNLLNPVLAKHGDLELSVRMGTLQTSEIVSSAGLRIGIRDFEDADARAACYFGRGIDAGIATDGFLFIDQQRTGLPDEFDYSSFTLTFRAEPVDSNYTLSIAATDGGDRSASLVHSVDTLSGLIALVNHFTRPVNIVDAPRFWFDDLSVEGSSLEFRPENEFGPILWSMYTLSRGVLKLTAQMAPLGAADSRTVELQIKESGIWRTREVQAIDTAACTATFRLDSWDASRTTPYRLVYRETGASGTGREQFYEGQIRRDPVDRPLTLAGMTCQYGTGFPYTPLVKNLAYQDPDMLYFSGDQIYESNGGYDIIRHPAGRAILNYLGKWYMFGWAFGDLMRDRPTVCTPDDHDVFQGNLWGEGGIKIPFDEWEKLRDSVGGYVQPAEMVNAVHRTQCSHLPDPYDPRPIEQQINVFYTDLLYGRISFAIISDRMFKSSPRKVAFWPGRADHVKEELIDMSVLEQPGLTLIGERQYQFLRDWVTDWRGADIKVVLSQSPFANIATHHGGDKMVLFADMDSNGWPKTARDRVLRLMRKAFAFHITGDQHIPSLSHYGVEDYRDGGWCFCTPAIYVGYERRFLPQRLGFPIFDPPAHGQPNTGYYKDPFDNLHYVYAIGNPVDEPVARPRYARGYEKASGYGRVRFDQKGRSIVVEAYRFTADVSKPQPENFFPGWPHTIGQLDNHGLTASGCLPVFEVSGSGNPVILITNETTNELEYALRMPDFRWAPPVFSDGVFSVKIGHPERDQWRVFSGLRSCEEGEGKTIKVDF